MMSLFLLLLFSPVVLAYDNNCKSSKFTYENLIRLPDYKTSFCPKTYKIVNGIDGRGASNSTYCEKDSKYNNFDDRIIVWESTEDMTERKKECPIGFKYIDSWSRSDDSINILCRRKTPGKYSGVIQRSAGDLRVTKDFCESNWNEFVFHISEDMSSNCKRYSRNDKEFTYHESSCSCSDKDGQYHNFSSIRPSTGKTWCPDYLMKPQCPRTFTMSSSKVVPEGSSQTATLLCRAPGSSVYLFGAPASDSFKVCPFPFKYVETVAYKLKATSIEGYWKRDKGRLYSTSLAKKLHCTDGSIVKWLPSSTCVLTPTDDCFAYVDQCPHNSVVEYESFIYSTTASYVNGGYYDRNYRNYQTSDYYCPDGVSRNTIKTTSYRKSLTGFQYYNYRSSSPVKCETEGKWQTSNPNAIITTYSNSMMICKKTVSSTEQPPSGTVDSMTGEVRDYISSVLAESVSLMNMSSMDTRMSDLEYRLSALAVEMNNIKNQPTLDTNVVSAINKKLNYLQMEFSYLNSIINNGTNAEDSGNWSDDIAEGTLTTSNSAENGDGSSSTKSSLDIIVIMFILFSICAILLCVKFNRKASGDNEEGVVTLHGGDTGMRGGYVGIHPDSAHNPVLQSSQRNDMEMVNHPQILENGQEATIIPVVIPAEQVVVKS